MPTYKNQFHTQINNFNTKKITNRTSIKIYPIKNPYTPKIRSNQPPASAAQLVPILLEK